MSTEPGALFRAEVYEQPAVLTRLATREREFEAAARALRVRACAWCGSSATAHRTTRRRMGSMPSYWSRASRRFATRSRCPSITAPNSTRETPA